MQHLSERCQGLIKCHFYINVYNRLQHAQSGRQKVENMSALCQRKEAPEKETTHSTMPRTGGKIPNPLQHRRNSEKTIMEITFYRTCDSSDSKKCFLQ